LRYVLDTGVTATLNDRAIDLAIAVSTVAVAPRELLPAALARIVDVRRELYRTRARRATVVTAEAPASRPAEAPNVGPMAPLMPQPIGRPPAGQTAEAPIDIGF